MPDTTVESHKLSFKRAVRALLILSLVGMLIVQARTEINAFREMSDYGWKDGLAFSSLWILGIVIFIALAGWATLHESRGIDIIVAAVLAATCCVGMVVTAGGGELLPVVVWRIEAPVIPMISGWMFVLPWWTSAVLAASVAALPERSRVTPPLPPPAAYSGSGVPMSIQPLLVGPQHPRATVALVLGILGLVACGGVTAPFAWVIGRGAVRDIEASGGGWSGRGVAYAGQVMGIVGTIILVLAIVVVAALVILAANANHY